MGFMSMSRGSLFVRGAYLKGYCSDFYENLISRYFIMIASVILVTDFLKTIWHALHISEQSQFFFNKVRWWDGRLMWA